MEYIIRASDVLVIGGGLAGLRAAYQAAEAGCTVTVVSKGPRCSADVSGFNAPVGADDSVELFVRDIHNSGMTLENSVLAETLARDSLKETAFLENLGLEFQKTPEGAYQLLQPLWCSVPRLVHSGTATGAEAERLLLQGLEEKGVQVEAPVTVVEILTAEGSVCGVLAHRSGADTMTVYGAKAVVLAAGGCGGLYEVSTYSKAICGDSAALAYRAGAELTNMEFIDFEPCCLVQPPHLKGRGVSSTMLFIGGVLRNTAGEDIIRKYFSDMSEVNKSRLSRAIFREVREGRGTANGGVYYDLTAVSREELEEHETYLGLLERNGIDLAVTPLEVAPAAHTCLGGVRTDERCSSSIPGLFAAGEAMGSLHGANRIGGNAGTEVFVFGAIAGASAAEYAKTVSLRETAALAAAKSVAAEAATAMKKVGETPQECAARIRHAVSAGVPLLRNEADLLELKEHLDVTAGFDGLTAEHLETYLALLSMTQTASIIAESSRIRCESRGVFNRSDYPETDPHLDHHNTLISKEGTDMKSRMEELS